jgi:hypothetical protein
VVAAAIGRGVAVLPDEDDRAATDRIMDTITDQVATARLLYGRQTPPGEDAWWTRHRGTRQRA